MPDSLITAAEPRARRELSAFELIERERRHLPSHRIEGGNFRRWALAACTAEVKHRDADFARCERVLGLPFDHYAEPDCVQMGQFAHEAHAGAALLWLSSLQAHESERRSAFDFRPWRSWSAERRAKWLERRHYLWRGFVKEVRAYQVARSELEQFLEEVR